jgi:OmcA/MtrC family decaheme c-type cytochrome
VTAEIVSVQNMRPGEMPVVRFKLRDRNGSITPLDAPTVPMDLVTPASPVPRRMTGLSLLLSGPTSDYLTGNAGITTSLLSRNGYTGAYTLATGFVTAEDPATHEFSYTFTKALPATATGTWAVSIEGRRRPDNSGVLPAYDLATDSFNWPYTGEAVSEHFTNDVRYVDLSTGALTAEPSRARRTVVSQAKCEACHLELNLHGANRHDVAHCVTCHTPDATDWDKRPRDTRTLADGGVVGSGMVLLSDPVDPAASTKSWGFATLDGLEERSIHLKTMVHRIHVGEREGVASLEGIRPFVIYGYRTSATAAPGAYFFDDIRFPGDLGNCELCHLPDAWTLEAIPADAQPTTANERGTILHTGTSTTPATSAHAASDPKVLPVTATCLSCHTSGAAADHAAAKTAAGVEQCGTCHGESGAESVRKRHSVR